MVDLPIRSNRIERSTTNGVQCQDECIHTTTRTNRTTCKRTNLILSFILAWIVVLATITSPIQSVSSAPLPSGLTGKPFTSSRLIELREGVRGMFTHAYEAYLKYAFPHDELKPLSKSWTDSLAELGNSKRVYKKYHGVALTMIDSLSTLAVLGNKTEFARAVDYISNNVHFDHDVRVNLFEANIRILGGLLSAHVLAKDPHLALYPAYDGGLLPLAKDLGDRFLPAFVNVRPYEEENENATTSSYGKGGKKQPKVQLPYAWINLKYGVEPGETENQCTAGIGTLLLEFGLLSHLTNSSVYYDVAERALFELWKQRNQQTNLIGNSLSCLTGEWSNQNAGIGAGIDSYYEYLLKSYIFFDNVKFLHMFDLSYEAVQRYLRFDRDWYVESDMHTGSHTHIQFNSLTGFWPGLQSLIGDFGSASATHEKHFGLWNRFEAGVPERFLLQQSTIHSSEKHYILRPEVIESTYFLYRSTKNPMYLEMGEKMFQSLETYARVPGGYASFRDLESKELEDRMNSFFLAETVKYLYLLFDEANWVHTNGGSSQPGGSTEESCSVKDGEEGHTRSNSEANWIFTTEGHLFPILSSVHEKFGDAVAKRDGRYTPTGPHGSILSSGHSKSKYSLFATPVSRMNKDTRLYYKRWKDREGVNFHHLAREATCPVNHWRAHLHDPKKQRDQMEWYRLVKVWHDRRKMDGVCPWTLPPASIPAGAKLVSSSTRPDAPSARPLKDFTVHVSDGLFTVKHTPSGESLTVRNLGTPLVEITDLLPLGSSSSSVEGGIEVLLRPITLDRNGAAHGFQAAPGLDSSFPANMDGLSKDRVERFDHLCMSRGGWSGLGPFFGPGASLYVPSGEYTISAELVVAVPIDGCNFDDSSLPEGFYQDKIIVIQRGSCVFVDKLIHAQQRGAKGVLMLNTETDGDHGAYKLLMMGDDGSGRQVTVPSIMLPKHSGDELLRCIQLHHTMDEVVRANNPKRASRPFRMVLTKYRLPSNANPSHDSPTGPHSMLHPRVSGDLHSFTVQSMGGWSINIEESNQQFKLKVL